MEQMSASAVRVAAGQGEHVSDETLAQRLRQGDMAAGEELVRRYAQPLMRYLKRLSGSDQVAEDLHQHTWLSVLQHIGRFDSSCGTGGFKSWLFRIATNKVTDYWRWRTRERTALEGMARIAESEWPDAGRSLEAQERHEKLKQAIARLPQNQREVLFLRHYANMKFSEIAEVLGCPLNTALGRMHKAVLKLRQLLE